MAKSRAYKEGLLEEYKSMLTEKGGFIAVDTKGVDADTLTQLKLRLKEEGTNLAVVKNSVFKIALNDTNQPVEAVNFAAQTGIVAYDTDPTVIAKLIKEVQKETKALEARYGVIRGTYLEGSRVMELAEIPPREVLLSKLLGSLNAPLSGFMNAATGNARGFVQVLKQISEKEN
jgi:large subunit ribosomal protein L10